MTQALIPFEEITVYPSSPTLFTCPGIANGCYITLHPSVLDDISEKMARWFEGRDEVSMIDMGVSDKQGLGYVILEWLECEIDALFLAILRDEEMVGDYTTYIRELEG